MTETNPYSAYTEHTILSSNPLGLVVALYEGAIESCVVARNSLANRDIPKRTKAINKIVGILTELLRTLNDTQGGEISLNLKRLYVYIQGRVIQAHTRQDAAPLHEVEKLLSTMLEGWKGASAVYSPAAERSAASSFVLPVQPKSSMPDEDHSYSAGVSYGGYFLESSELGVTPAYSF